MFTMGMPRSRKRQASHRSDPGTGDDRVLVLLKREWEDTAWHPQVKQLCGKDNDPELRSIP